MPDFKKKLYDKTISEIEMNIWSKQPVTIKDLKNKNADIKHKVFFNKEKNEIKNSCVL